MRKEDRFLDSTSDFTTCEQQRIKRLEEAIDNLDIVDLINKKEVKYDRPIQVRD